MPPRHTTEDHNFGSRHTGNVQRITGVPMKHSSPHSLLLLAFAAPIQAQWIGQQTSTDADVRGLSVVSTDVVWASGANGTVLHTTNGGKTWKLDTIPGASNLDLRAIAGTSSRVAHAMSI